MRMALLAGGVIVAAGLMLAPRSAPAQFICQQFGGTNGGATATGTNSVACGTNAEAAALSTAVGFHAGNGATNNTGSTFIGYFAGSSTAGHDNTAIGNSTGAGVIGDSNSALGWTAGQYVTGDNNVAMGSSAGSGSPGTPLTISNTVAIGSSATARADGAVAIGTGAQATRVNQFALGTTTNTYTMAGIASAASLAAQTGPVQLVTSDASGNLATMNAADLGLASAADLSAINARLSGMQTQIDTNRVEALRGIAAAMALTTAPMPSAVGRTSWAANVAAFRGEAATGASFAHRLNTPVPLALTGGYAYGGGNAHGGRVGFQGEF